MQGKDPFAELSSETLGKMAREKLPGYEIAWNTLVERHHKPLIRHLLFMFQGDLNLIEDAVQETWINLYRRIHTFKGDNFKAWLTRSAKHEVLRLKQKNNRVIQLNPDEPALKRLLTEDGPSPSNHSALDSTSIDIENNVLKNDEDRENRGIKQILKLAYESSLCDELKENIERFIYCLKKLSKTKREIFISILEGFSEKQIGRILRIPTGTVKSRKSDLKDSMTQCMKPSGR
jgi:RNA polymerase sigma factor (sigma-70 family)